jgi:murein DD-endopeptidase MepM/ murein hydrolase activator NlpD
MPAWRLGASALLALLWVLLPGWASPAGGAPTDGGAPAGRWVWPLPGGRGPDGPPGAAGDGGWSRVTHGFDPPDRPYGPGHRGVDLAGHTGDHVVAAGAGVVSYAAVLAGRGVVAVTHPGGLRTTYEPVRVLVEAGRRVDAGDLLGTLLAGHPGCPGDACLHWGLLRGRDYLDPLGLLGRGPVRLLPVGPAPRPRPPSDDWAGPDPPAGRALVRSAGAAADPPADRPGGPDGPWRAAGYAGGVGLALLGAVLAARRRPP